MSVDDIWVSVIVFQYPAGASTVIVFVALKFSSADVAVITALPVATPLVRPPETVAVFRLSEVQVTSFVMSIVSPLLYVPIA